MSEAEVERLNTALDNMRAEYERNLNHLEAVIANIAKDRWTRDGTAQELQRIARELDPGMGYE